jgi:diacylglycerol kinase (ATP)
MSAPTHDKQPVNTTSSNKGPGYTGIKRIFFAAVNSYKGAKWMLLNEAAFRQEVLLLIVAAVITFLINVTFLEQVIMILAILFVMLVETINTAIEAVVDRIGPEFHELSGLAKDLGSTAVFIAMMIATIIWAYILLF